MEDVKLQLPSALLAQVVDALTNVPDNDGKYQIHSGALVIPTSAGAVVLDMLPE